MAGYKELDKTLMKVSGEILLLVQQVMDGWHKSQGQAMFGTNHWNLYAAYFTRHEQQDHCHLGLSLNVPSQYSFLPCLLLSNTCVSVTPTVRGQLYAKFKEDNPKTYTRDQQHDGAH